MILPHAKALVLVLGTGAVLLPGSVFGQDADDLARALANPIAAMTVLPLQTTYDGRIGPARDGSRVTSAFQPIFPFRLSEDWNLLSRTIVPFIWQRDIVPGIGEQSGIGDVLQSFFFSPAQSQGGITWGIGPAIQAPTGDAPFLGQGVWAAGPTGVVLMQSGPWTTGILANHLWSFAGDSAMPEVNRTFLQPFINYNIPGGWTLSLSSEANYDWTTQRWTAPVRAGVSRLFTVGGQPISVGVQGGYWVATTDASPHGWSARLNVSLLFPVR